MGTVIDKECNELKTAIAFHPGAYLLEEIEERQLKKTDLAKRIGILPGNLIELFKGKRNINARMAVRLEIALGIRAEYWMGLQSAYDLILPGSWNTLNFKPAFYLSLTIKASSSFAIDSTMS